MSGITTSFSAKYTSHKKQRLYEIERKLEDGMIRACAIVERQAKINVSKSPPDHPQVQTGRLWSSITHRVTKEGGEVVGVVGTNVEYGPTLEFGTSWHPPYPWLFPAVESRKDDILRALKEGGGIL